MLFRSLLAQASLPLRFWDDAILTACYLINRMPSHVIHNDTPFHKLFKNPIRYDMLRVFGCACWPNLRPYNNRKLEFRSRRCVFLGYSPDHLGFRCLDRSTGRIYVSRDVIFDERVFPFAADSPKYSSPTEDQLLLPEPLDSSVCSDRTPATDPAPSSVVVSGGIHVDVDRHLHAEHAAPDVDHAHQPEAPGGPEPESPPPPSPSTPTGPAHDEPNPSPASTPSTAASTPPAPAAHPMRTRLRNNIVQPARLPDGMIRYDTAKRAFAAEPVSHVDALGVPDRKSVV